MKSRFPDLCVMNISDPVWSQKQVEKKKHCCLEDNMSLSAILEDCCVLNCGLIRIHSFSLVAL